jgi:hypothetical protein
MQTATAPISNATIQNNTLSMSPPSVVSVLAQLQFFVLLWQGMCHPIYLILFKLKAGIFLRLRRPELLVVIGLAINCTGSPVDW